MMNDSIQFREGTDMASAATAGSAKSLESGQPLSKEELRKMHAYRRAANYLSVGQIYLYANPLLHEPLKIEHIKPRLLDHWGTTPGLNFIYVQVNRLIKKRDLNVIYVAGPRLRRPGLVANTYLEGTYSEFYPPISQTKEGLRRLFKQFSFPGGIPSHVAPETPGSIHVPILGIWVSTLILRRMRSPLRTGTSLCQIQPSVSLSSAPRKIGR
jgi:phosphoketolase